MNYEHTMRQSWSPFFPRFTLIIKQLRVSNHLTTDKPPSTDRCRYRADHHQNIDQLDLLEQSFHLIKTEHNKSVYELSPYALPVIQTERSENILNIMREIYNTLQKTYKEQLSSPISVKNIIIKMTHPKQDILEALYYLTETHSIWSGKGSGFPYNEDSTINISESIIKYSTLDDIIIQYYGWHFTSQKKKSLSSGPLAASFGHQNMPIHQKWINKLQNHPLIAIIIVAFITITALASFTNSISDLLTFSAQLLNLNSPLSE